MQHRAGLWSRNINGKEFGRRVFREIMRDMLRLETCLNFGLSLVERKLYLVDSVSRLILLSWNFVRALKTKKIKKFEDRISEKIIGDISQLKILLNLRLGLVKH